MIRALLALIAILPTQPAAAADNDGDLDYFVGFRGRVDSGSGYCSQSDMPVHLGIPAVWAGRVDIEITSVAGGSRHVSMVRTVDPNAYLGRWLRIITTR